MRKIFISILLIAILGALGAAFYIYNQERIEDKNWQQLHLSEALYEKDEYEAAINNLTPVVKYGKSFEGAENAHYLLAQCYDAQNDPNAVSLWQQYIETFPESERVDRAKLNLADAQLQESPKQSFELYKNLESTSTLQTIRDEARLGLAKYYEKTGNQDKSRQLFYEILDHSEEQSVVSYAKDKLTQMNTETLWSPALDEFSELYTVQRGDAPIIIAKKYKTTAWYIKEANNIRNNIHPGKRLKVPSEPLYVVVNKGTCRLNLYNQSDRFIKWYPVGIGKQSWKTPAGEYEIINKEIDPVWYKPGGGVIDSDDPENALGSRWMGIGNSLGIHGTNEPETIGKRSSAGCIRMYNEDVEELYKLITYGTKVIIKEGKSTEAS